MVLMTDNEAQVDLSSEEDDYPSPTVTGRKAILALAALGLFMGLTLWFVLCQMAQRAPIDLIFFLGIGELIVGKAHWR